MIIIINSKSTKFCQITLHIKRFIHKRKVVPFSLPRSVDLFVCAWSYGSRTGCSCTMRRARVRCVWNATRAGTRPSRPSMTSTSPSIWPTSAAWGAWRSTRASRPSRSSSARPTCSPSYSHPIPVSHEWDILWYRADDAHCWVMCIIVREREWFTLLSDEVLLWLSVWNKVQTVCIWSSWCHCIPITPSSLASFKSRMVFIFEFRYLWHCWLGGRKGIWPVKNWAVGCWHGYLPGARCRLAYGPADATATHCLLLQ